MRSLLERGDMMPPGGPRPRIGAVGIAGAGLPQPAGASSGRNVRRFSLA